MPKPIAITLSDGKTRHLLLDFNALCIAEELTGKNLLDDKNWKSPNASQVRALVYAALKSDDPEITLEIAGSLLVGKDAEAIVVALGKAQAEHMGEEPVPLEKGKAKAKKKG